MFQIHEALWESFLRVHFPNAAVERGPLWAVLLQGNSDACLASAQGRERCTREGASGRAWQVPLMARLLWKVRLAGNGSPPAACCDNLAC